MRTLIICLLLVTNLYANDSADFYAFCYHDVRDDVQGKLDNDGHALNSQYLAQHFQWLKENNYQVISNQDIMRAKKGEIKLPQRAVSLSFDDGYESIYTHVYPLLKTYNYPATIGIVTSWIEKQESDEYQRPFLSWAQIKELSESPLIEMASHSHNLHKGILANPQGNSQPAATSRLFGSPKGYETDREYTSRIKNDLNTSYNLIKNHTGKAPDTLIWPYGSYSEIAWEIAKSIGFKHSMVLTTPKNKLSSKSDHIQRHLIANNPAPHEFASMFQPKSYYLPQRVMHIDLDYVYDTNLAQQIKNLDALIDRVKNMKISTIYLQAFADEDGDGNASALYFPNTVLPVKADLFNRVSWQLRTRAGVEVYAWMPVSAFVHPDPEINQQWQVKSQSSKKPSYLRWSIFKPKAKSAIKEIYQSLGKYADFAGLLFHDDAYLDDFEDVNPEALRFYHDNGVEIKDIKDVSLNPVNKSNWTQLKTKALIDFTLELTEIIKLYRPEIKTARNLYANAIMHPESEKWFAHNFKEFIKAYDFTAIMAMPLLENAADPESWFESLISKIMESDVDPKKLVFELQTKDWRSKKYINEDVIIKQMKLLTRHGFSQYGYYPDDFINNHPQIEKIFPYFSLSEFPFVRE